MGMTRRNLLSAALAAALAPPMATAIPAVRTWRAYWPTPLGQLHVHNAAPQGSGGTRTALVCFHPTAYSGNFFAEFWEHMATDRWLLCPDTPGFGSSDLNKEAPTMGDYADAMAACLDSLGFGEGGAGPVDLLGFHTGCFIATELAARRPDLVRRIALPGIPFESGADREEALARTAKPSELYSDPRKLESHWRERWEWQGKAVTLPRLLDLLAEELKSGPDYWWAYRAVFTYPVEERFPLVKAPALALATGGDLFEPTQAACDLLPDCRVVRRDELEAPLFNAHAGEVAKEVRKFLDGDAE